jgi:hypothetical protein
VPWLMDHAGSSCQLNRQTKHWPAATRKPATTIPCNFPEYKAILFLGKKGECDIYIMHKENAMTLQRFVISYL